MRFFTRTDESDEQLEALATAAVLLMATMLRPLGNAITELPAGPSHPGRTAGPSFEMFHQMGNFIPDRRAAWTMLVERLGMLAERCRQLDGQPGVPAAARLGSIVDLLGKQLPA